MLNKDRYIDILKEVNEPITIAHWAALLIEKYPSILTQKDRKTNKLMNLQALVTNLSIQLSKGEFPKIKVFDEKPYRKVIYVTEAKKNDYIKKEVYQDLLSVLIKEKIQSDTKKLTEYDKYRLQEFLSITEQLNRYFGIGFILHHIVPLKHETRLGKHHPDNLEILTQEHSLLRKENDKKFTIEEQKAYIKRIIVIHMMINKNLQMSVTDEVLDMLLDRLEKVY